MSEVNKKHKQKENNMSNERLTKYAEGFDQACAQRGIDSVALLRMLSGDTEKKAQLTDSNLADILRQHLSTAKAVSRVPRAGADWVGSGGLTGDALRLAGGEGRPFGATRDLLSAYGDVAREGLTGLGDVARYGASGGIPREFGLRGIPGAALDQLRGSGEAPEGRTSNIIKLLIAAGVLGGGALGVSALRSRRQDEDEDE